MVSSSVIDALRQTSKGQLKYDRHGDESIIGELADLTRSRNSLSFLPINTCKKTDSPAKIPIKEQGEKVPLNKSWDGNDLSAHDVVEIDPEDFMGDLLLVEYEKERREKLKKMVANKAADFENHSLLEAEQAEIKFRCFHQRQSLQLQQQKAEQLAQMAARTEELEQLKHSQKERTDFNIQQTRANIKEALRTQKEMDAEMLHKRHQQESRIAVIQACQKSITSKYQVIAQALRICANTDLLPETVKDEGQKQKDVAIALDRLISAAKTSTLTAQDLEMAHDLGYSIDEYMKHVVEAVDVINRSQTEMQSVPNNDSSDFEGKFEEQNVRDDVPKEPHFEVDGSAVALQQIESELNTSASSNIQTKNTAITSFCISPDALHEYTLVQNCLKAHQLAYQELQNDTASTLKKYKFDLQKAVNTPVNAISPLSGSHIKDKLERLKKLLRGQMVEVSGMMVTASKHPQAIFLCKDHLAKKFVKQGEEQVASKFEAAFAIASAIIALWIEFPDFGPLLLAHFYKKCPYTLPFYVPRTEGQTQEEHYRSMGYTYTDGVIERQDKFLKRMGGMIRLYAAIICTPVPLGISSPHPYGIENGWKWLARILNMEPCADITATLLYDFLEMAGYAMHAAYGSQFEKMLLALCKEFFGKIKQVTPPGAGGPIIRLEGFLQKCTQSGKMPPPQGQLSQNFWYT